MNLHFLHCSVNWNKWNTSTMTNWIEYANLQSTKNIIKRFEIYLRIINISILYNIITIVEYLLSSLSHYFRRNVSRVIPTVTSTTLFNRTSSRWRRDVTYHDYSFVSNMAGIKGSVIDFLEFRFYFFYTFKKRLTVNMVLIVSSGTLVIFLCIKNL